MREFLPRRHQLHEQSWLTRSKNKKLSYLSLRWYRNWATLHLSYYCNCNDAARAIPCEPITN